MELKNYYKQYYDDVCEQKLTFDVVYGRADVEKRIVDFADRFGSGLLGYSGSGRNYTVYTSQKFQEFLGHLRKNFYIVDVNGEEHRILTPIPCFISQQACIETVKDGRRDMYDCTFFKPGVTALSRKDREDFYNRLKQLDWGDIHMEMEKIYDRVHPNGKEYNHAPNGAEAFKEIEQIVIQIRYERGLY